jgi:hypothetical protein
MEFYTITRSITRKLREAKISEGLSEWKPLLILNTIGQTLVKKIQTFVHNFVEQETLLSSKLEGFYHFSFLLSRVWKIISTTYIDLYVYDHFPIDDLHEYSAITGEF